MTSRALPAAACELASASKSWISRLFHRASAAEVMTDQLFEAERLQCEHQAAAELHAGLAVVYRVRMERLRAALNTRADLRAVR